MEVGFTGRSIGGYNLDREQQYAYQRSAGILTFALLSQIVQASEYRGLGDGDKAKVIDYAIGAARDQVRDPINKVLDDDEFNALAPDRQSEVIDALLTQSRR